MHNILTAVVLCMTLIFLCASLDGCKPRQSHIPLVGIVLKDTTNPKFQDIERGARKAAKEENAEILVLAPEQRDQEKQLQIIYDLLDMKVDALCIAPEGPDGCIPGITKATSLKIPVILVESDIDHDKAKAARADVTSLVIGDNRKGGEMAARYISKKINDIGIVAVMEGRPVSLTGQGKKEGFMKAIKEYPGITVISTDPGYYKRSRAFDIGLGLIKKHHALKGVFAFNDAMAIGVSDALIISGWEKECIIVGFDGTEEGKRAIKEGRIDASLTNNPFQMGKLAIKYSLMAARGEKVPPLSLIKTELITRDSLLLPFE
jgi:ribose transport system substrate-binding protein